MRIAVDYRFLAAGPGAVNRGVGRYTQQQLRAVLKADAENEYLLVVYADTADTAILPEIRHAPNVRLARLPRRFPRGAQVNDGAAGLRNAARLDAWLKAQRADLFHATVPFMITEVGAHDLMACPLVTTLYDLIPLLFPAHFYAVGTVDYARYVRSLNLVRSAAQLIAISESARADAYLYLGFPPERAAVAYPLADPIFAPLPPAEAAGHLEGLAARLGWPSFPARFALSVSHLHYNKNLTTLLDAYALLPPGLRRAMPLLLPTHFAPQVRAQLESLIAARGLADSVVVLGLVRDEELVALYNLATVVVHPSRYEGFGLPVVEAMQCGAPVITTTASSLPEAAGEAACYVEAEDAPGMAAAIAQLAEDHARRAALREAGLRQAARFDADQLGANTLHAYDQALRAPHPAFTPAAARPPRRQGQDLMENQPPARTSLNFNRATNLSDFRHPEMAALMRDIFPQEVAKYGPQYPQGAEHRKHWEIAFAVRTLRHFGALHDTARILGVGAGTETTIFYLTNHVGQVYATDLYYTPGSWETFAPAAMLIAPERFAPYPFRRERLIVQHMDGRLLRYPDNFFDGIFSSGSVEHFGSLEFVANAAYEMGRVLKPGGVLTLSTELKLAGPAEGLGFDSSTLLLSREQIMRHIVEASGLELVDELDLGVDEATMRTPRDLLAFIQKYNETVAHDAPNAIDTQVGASELPHIVLTHQGYVFTSVHLALRKTERYPAVPNQWAKPGPRTAEAVEQLNVQQATSSAPNTNQASQPASAQPAMRRLLKEWDAVRLYPVQSRLSKGLPAPLAFVMRVLLRLRKLGEAWEAQNAMFRNLAGRVDVLETRVAQSESVYGALRRQAYLNSALGIDAGQLVNLLRDLERELPELAAARAVELSIQDIGAEAALVAGAEYFGARMASSGPTYRAPNDAWYHVDFTPGWNRPALLRNAPDKLKHGGLFVLITLADNAPAPTPLNADGAALTLRLDRAFEQRGTLPVRVYVWQVS
jgi:glycosyltransferase involved in cell wall biosynthesis/SAM-dependent methyltransferase